MRTHLAFYLALGLGLIAAIALTIASGFGIDMHLPLGHCGVLAFLGVAVLIFFSTEALAGLAGDWVDQWRLRRGRP